MLLPTDGPVEFRDSCVGKPGRSERSRHPTQFQPILNKNIYLPRPKSYLLTGTFSITQNIRMRPSPHADCLSLHFSLSRSLEGILTRSLHFSLSRSLEGILLWSLHFLGVDYLFIRSYNLHPRQSQGVREIGTKSS